RRLQGEVRRAVHDAGRDARHVRAAGLVERGRLPDAQPDAPLARVPRQGRGGDLRRRADPFAARQPQAWRHPRRGARARHRRAGREVLPPGHGDPGRLSPRHALCRAARGAAARPVPPELRLLPPGRGPRPCRRRQLLRALRRAPDLRRDPGRRARDQAAQDGRHLLVLPLRRHGLGPHLSARRRRPPAGLGHAAAQVALRGRPGAPRVLPPGSARDPARVLRAGALMEWWLWPIALLACTFAMGIVAVLAGVGGGVLFVPIVGAFFPFHLDFVRAAGLLLALTGALSAAPTLLRSGLASLRLAMPLALVGSLGSIAGALIGLALP